MKKLTISFDAELDKSIVDGLTLTKFLDMIKSRNIPNDATLELDYVEEYHGWGDDYTTYTKLLFRWSREETDEEYATRIEEEEKIKLAEKEKVRLRRKELAAERKERDRKEYERLKKKFEKNKKD